MPREKTTPCNFRCEGNIPHATKGTIKRFIRDLEGPTFESRRWSDRMLPSAPAPPVCTCDEEAFRCRFYRRYRAGTCRRLSPNRVDNPGRPMVDVDSNKTVETRRSSYLQIRGHCHADTGVSYDRVYHLGSADTDTPAAIALPRDKVVVAIDHLRVQFAPRLWVRFGTDVLVDVLQLYPHHRHGRPNGHCSSSFKEVLGLDRTVLGSLSLYRTWARSRRSPRPVRSSPKFQASSR